MKKRLIPLLFLLFGLGAPAWAFEPPAEVPELKLPAPGQGAFVPGEVLLKVKPGVSAVALAATVDAVVARPVGDGSIALLRLRAGDVPTAAAALKGRAGVAFAEPNWLRQLHSTPGDPGFGLKWDLDNPGTLCNGSDCASAGADIAWQQAYDALGASFAGSAVIAVIDTGIDRNHPDLNDKVLPGYDFLSGDADPADTYGHGTHVAGISLAETGNATGTVGVGFSPNIKVMPLRVCDQNGCPTSAIVDAIYYAAGHGANVINLSLGGAVGSSSERQAIDAAWNAGLVVVASSGNDGSGKVSYPAAFANAIAVGATDWHDQVTRYSNKGSALDLTAPGGDMFYYHDPGGIYSTMPTYPVYLTTSYGYGRNYDQLQGTSMAAPQVSGLAALLFSLGTVDDSNGNGRSNDEIRAILEATADDLGSAGWDRSFGWGRINVYQAVLAATGTGGGGADPPPPPPPGSGGVLSMTVATDGSTYANRDTVRMTAVVTDGSNPVVSATVHFTVTAPLKTLACDATTDGNGTASCAYKVNTKRDGVGTFTVDATASKAGYTEGSDSTTFTVQ